MIVVLIFITKASVLRAAGEHWIKGCVQLCPGFQARCRFGLRVLLSSILNVYQLSDFPAPLPFYRKQIKTENVIGSRLLVRPREFSYQLHFYQYQLIVFTLNSSRRKAIILSLNKAPNVFHNGRIAES